MSNIGSHKLGKQMLGLRAMVNGGLNAFFMGPTKHIDASLPYN